MLTVQADGSLAPEAPTGGVTDIVSLDDVDITNIAADDCLMGNAAGTAIVQGSCAGSGGGGGDITAVIAGDGLSGGGSTGAVSLAVDGTVARDSDIRTNAEIDARIEPAARANNPSGQYAESRIPATITRDTELPDVSGFLTQTQVDARVTSGALQPGDITGGANVTVTPTTDGVTIAATGGGGGTADGVVDGVAFDGKDLTIERSIGDLTPLDIDEIVHPVAGALPDAEDHQGRVAVSGNQVLESIDHGAVDKVVVFKRYGTRTVLSGEPAKTTQENNFQGAFNVPPDISAYDASDFLWDRGSQLWLFKQNQNDATWRGFGGPANFEHGSLYADEDTAARHVTLASQLADVFVIGTGSGQHVFIVTSFTAATAANWQWDVVGLTVGDVSTAIAGELSDDTPQTVHTVGEAGAGDQAARDTHRHAGVGTLTGDEGIQVNQTTGNVTVTARLSSAAPEPVGATENAGGTDDDHLEVPPRARGRDQHHGRHRYQRQHQPGRGHGHGDRRRWHRPANRRLFLVRHL